MSGLQPRRQAPPSKIKCADGSIATTPLEVAIEFSFFFSNIYGHHPTFDPSVLNLLKQETCFSDLDSTPSDVEIVTSINKLNPSSPSASGLIHARLWQALTFTDSGLHKHHLQNGKSVYLVFYQRKVFLSNPGNYHGIMMLEAAYKIVANIILTRLKPINESVQLDHEYQNGFRLKRGCMDSIFTLKQLINKRAEHGLTLKIGFY